MKHSPSLLIYYAIYRGRGRGGGRFSIKYSGTSIKLSANGLEIGSLYRGLIISGFFYIYFVITGLKNIERILHGGARTRTLFSGGKNKMLFFSTRKKRKK